MNKNDFISKLQGVIGQGDDFQVLIYFAMNTENGVCLKKADIKRDVLSRISRGYQSSIQEEIDLFAQDNERELLFNNPELDIELPKGDEAVLIKTLFPFPESLIVAELSI